MYTGRAVKNLGKWGRGACQLLLLLQLQRLQLHCLFVLLLLQ